MKDWQSQNGLKVDGLLKPGGPTITSLKQAAPALLSDVVDTLFNCADHSSLSRS